MVTFIFSRLQVEILAQDIVRSLFSPASISAQVRVAITVSFSPFAVLSLMLFFSHLKGFQALLLILPSLLSLPLLGFFTALSALFFALEPLLILLSLFIELVLDALLEISLLTTFLFDLFSLALELGTGDILTDLSLSEIVLRLPTAVLMVMTMLVLSWNGFFDLSIIHSLSLILLRCSIGQVTTGNGGEACGLRQYIVISFWVLKVPPAIVVLIIGLIIILILVSFLSLPALLLAILFLLDGVLALMLCNLAPFSQLLMSLISSPKHVLQLVSRVYFV